MRFDGDVTLARAASWTILVPVKRLSTAKSRMTTAGLRDVDALAMAFFQDTLAAATGCPAVERVVVATSDVRVTDWARGAGATVFDDSDSVGINGAVRAASSGVGGNLAVLVSDLPCSSPDALAAWLRRAGRHSTAFVADAAGTGTTMWTRLAGQPTDPRFGIDSRSAHRGTGCIDLVDVAGGDVDEDGLDRIRRDVDTPSDLVDALRIGVGPATAAAVATAELT